MMTKFETTASIAASAVFLLVSVGSPGRATAFGGRHGGHCSDGGKGGFGGGVLQQVVHPCQAACFADARNCRNVARAAAVTCVNDACGAQITAARAACTPTNTMQACKSAMGNLQTCGTSCLETFHSAAGTCHDTAVQCRQACGTSS